MRLRSLLGPVLGVLACIACQRDPPTRESWEVSRILEVSDSTHTSIVFTNGRRLELPLRDVSVHAHLVGQAPAPWVLISGWSCRDCDVEEQVFAVRADTSLGEEWPPHYSFPGELTLGITDSAVFRSRLYVGACLDSLPSAAVWAQEARDSLTGTWTRSAHLLVPRRQLVDTVVPLTSALEENLRRSVESGGCREVPGKNQPVF